MYLPLLLPALSVYIVLFIFPAVFGMTLSFSSWAGLGSPFRWVGVKNYANMLSSPVFLSSFWNTLALTTVVGVAIFLIACGAMIVLRTTKGHSFIRSAIFVPFIISPIAIGLSVSFLFNPQGLINTALGFLGLNGMQRPWLAPDGILQVIMVGLTWSAAGFYVVLLMSAVDGIPSSLYEAAQIEGANLLQQFRNITLPLTRDMISVAAVLWVIAGIKTFEIIIAFTGTAGNPPVQARSLAVEQYLRVTGGHGGGIPQLGSAAAIGVIMTAITVVLILISRRISHREPLEM